MKKKLSLLLALVLAFSVFAVACGGKKATDETEAPAAETEAPAAETEAPAAETEADETEADETEAPAAETEDMHIELVSKGMQHAFWVAVKTGAEQAAADYGVTMNFDGPASESEIQAQVTMLDNAMAKQPSAIALAALSTDAVMTQLESAKSAGLPIIGFDSGVPNAPEGSIYANASTDNVAAGALAAENLFPYIEEEINAATPEAQVRIGIVSQDATSESIISRTQGFLDKMVELIGADKVAVVGQDMYALDGQDEATASVLLNVGVPATPEAINVQNTAKAVIDADNTIAVYGSNEGAANGIIDADTNDLGGVLGNRAEDPSKIWAVGFDAGIKQKEAIMDNRFVGSITQDPFQIGYKAVELAVLAAKGDPVEDVDTGAKWYNAENLDTEEMQMLVYD